jgi:exopolysaccharide biosynthesis protein
VILKKGSSGKQVESMQLQLKVKEYDIDIDGRFGPGTKAALKCFQADNKLKVDGIYGPNSQKKMQSAKGMKFQSYWLDRQTQIIKMRRTITTANLINVKSMTVKRLLKTIKQKPVLLINGGLFDMKTGADLNKAIDEYKEIGAGYYSKRGLRIKYDRSIDFGKYKNDRDFLGGSPALLIDGKRLNEFPDLDHEFIYSKHPRIGVGANEKFIYIVVVNGRSRIRRWYGATLRQFTNIFIKLECDDAINLDGGGSITVITKVGKFLKIGYRKVANMIAFYQD